MTIITTETLCLLTRLATHNQGKVTYWNDASLQCFFQFSFQCSTSTPPHSFFVFPVPRSPHCHHQNHLSYINGFEVHRAIGKTNHLGVLDRSLAVLLNQSFELHASKEEYSETEKTTLNPPTKKDAQDGVP